MSSGVLLGGGYPWRSLEIDRLGERPFIVANDRLGLSLAPVVGGAFGLESPDDSLGRLTLPRGVAVSGDRLFTLSSAGDRVFRFDPVTMRMGALGEVGREGLLANADERALAEPRRFARAANIAAFGSWLYVVDPASSRVQVFDVDSLVLVAVHSNVGDPIDVAAGPDGVYVLDHATGKVLRDRPGLASLEVVVDAPYRAGRWDRIALDRDGRIYLRDSVTRPSALDVFDAPCAGRPNGSHRVSSGADVRERFDPPRVRAMSHGVLEIDHDLLDPCGLRRAPKPTESVWQTEARRYVVDREARVVKVHLRDGRERHRFGPLAADGRRVHADAPDAWRPVDAAVLGEQFYVLDEKHQTVHVHRADADSLRLLCAAPAAHPRHWVRMAADGQGCLLLWDGGDRVDRLDPAGRLIGDSASGPVVPLFRETATPASPPPVPEITRDGPRTTATRLEWPEPSFERHGVWVSDWLDSEIYNCQWDRVTLNLSALPPGASIVLRTRSAAKRPGTSLLPTLDEAVGAAMSWQTNSSVVADPQPPLGPQLLKPAEFLVLSAPGRYLQVQIELASDGVRSPVVGHVRLSAPRESWLEFLPAVYAKPDDQRQFLERYLAMAESTWSELEGHLDHFDRFLDPASVPSEHLGYLASWLDLTLEGALEPDQQRRILRELPRMWRTWGTVAGLRAWVRVHLAALTGLALEDLERLGVPGIVEAFVERRHLWLDRPDTATIGPTEALWSPSVERRFQVGVFDRLGDVELVSAGAPDLDVFRHYAHRFRVYVPAAWVKTADHEALLRRAIDLQRPAHTTFELVLVEPRFRVGDQSTIALDTVIGGRVPWQFECPTDTDQSRRPGHRLAYDTVLGGRRQTTSGPGAVLG